MSDKKRLWRVSVETTIYVMAEDWVSAQDCAERNAKYETGVSLARIVESINSVSPGARDSIPYGGDGERTIRQILRDK